MPTYEYECKSCSKTFEVFQSMSEAPLRVCPDCGQDIKRLIGGGTGVIFKGSGFYVNDSRKSSSAGASSGASSAASSSAGASPAPSSGAKEAV